MRLRAMAKINLGLDVIKKRDDGYHEVRMIMQTIRMYDQIDLAGSDRPGIQVKTNLPYLPSNENNLVYKAAKLLMDEFHIEKGLDIRLRKVIPVAAGLGGGSSDAAAVMVGVNRMFHLNLSLEELADRGKTIGADVPYCIMRGTALAEGIGEILTQLPSLPPCHILVAKPGINVSTKNVYKSLRADEIQNHPDIDGIIDAIRGSSLMGVTARMANVLEEVTVRDYPVIDEIKQLMMERGALSAMMSGSGPSVFGIFDDRRKAGHAYRQLQDMNLVKQIFLTKPFAPGGR
ncbi:4-(cytidine 5'-diphospho)-2-C-methyl-D-erythritol kinase [Novisyntrophococcus fermenticellae]|uniref:4-(cytidine 5'-diphospho)-2-C-methyl-D-erythritol kinase n=1 Tax=Novisyntrophococcus fermenticellae TaxID=2068655 RepID=UPI001E5C2BAC|nr:4-(cytidine 5'-diphospho)-2-C-methyl-D-erythritol kinase [Novisyntrophococcus fermenticellae]